jgi:type I restriction enzyme, S subunit
MAVDSLRDTFHTNRVNPNDLNDRLTAQSYRPDIIKAIKQIHDWGKWDRLKNLCDQPISQGRTPVYASTGRVCLKTRNVVNLIVSRDEVDWVSEEHAKTVKRFWIQDEDLLMTRSGSGSIGRVSIYFGDDEPLTNEELFRISVSNSYDSAFVGSFLTSWWGERLIEQGISGSTGQLKLVQDHVTDLPVILPDSKAQKYIGDKVRQAERLRDRSRELDINAKDKVSEYFDCFKASPRRKIYSTEAQCITGRIDSWSYNPRFLEAVAAINNSGSTLIDLEKITQKITNGATPKGAIFSNKGVPWIRGKDFSNGDIIAESLPMMDIHSESMMKRSRLEYGDLLLSIKGTVGDVAVVDESLVGFNINQDVARIQLGSIEEAHFLALFLESSLGQVLIEQQVYGAINPFFSLENLRAFLVPDPNSIDRVYKSLVVGLRSKSVVYRRFSNWLTVAAKLLVEALIEGKLSEAELIAAQEGLEKGDTTLDREILDRLTRKGIDNPNEPPLFPDLDALYTAMASLDETTEVVAPSNSQTAKVYDFPKPYLALASEDRATYQVAAEVPE